MVWCEFSHSMDRFDSSKATHKLRERGTNGLMYLCHIKFKLHCSSNPVLIYLLCFAIINVQCVDIKQMFLDKMVVVMAAATAANLHLCVYAVKLKI